MNHDFQKGWRLFEVIKAYPGSGTLTFNIVTNVNNTHELAEPWSNYATGFHREIRLFDVPDLPAGHDWQVIFAGDTVAGSLDGVSGTFSCAVGFCYLEDFRDTPAPGYHPGGSEVLFTPDDADLPPDHPAVRYHGSNDCRPPTIWHSGTGRTFRKTLLQSMTTT